MSDELTCECERCRRCRGSGEMHWYLGDEFNSQGYSTCDSCGGSGTVADDCLLHGPSAVEAPF